MQYCLGRSARQLRQVSGLRLNSPQCIVRCGQLCGARDGNRTRTPKGREIFFTLRFSPPTNGRSCAGLCLGRSFRFRPPPSSLYTFPFRGLARCCLATRAGGSPNLTGFTRTLSPSGAQFVKSLVSTNFTTRARAGRHST